MKLRFATLAFTALIMTFASSASAFPRNVTSIPSELLANVQVTTGGIDQVARMGFWRTGPIGVLVAKTHLTGDGRLQFYAGSKGFVVNQTGAVYDLEGGAIYKMKGNLAVTGSYRMLGYDLLATGTENTNPQLSGIFVGLQFEF